MKVAGIISEYNPFHNGHKYHINRTRENGATHIIAVMSGNFVQRGDAAVFDKRTRAMAALLCGADMVIELPTAYACSSAQRFAYCGVGILNMLGCVDLLSFGSESADAELLSAAANAASDSKTDRLIGELLQDGITYAAARQQAVTRLFGERTGAVLGTPNDILAIEYLSELKKLHSNIKPLAVKRFGAHHDSCEANDNIASASNIREKIYSNIDYADFVPPEAYRLYRGETESGRAPVSLKRGDRAVMWRLRSMTAEDFYRLPDVSEGLGNRLFGAAAKASSLDMFYSLAKTKRFTMSRIKRLALYSALGIYDYPEISYIKVLGIGRNGADLLSKIKANCPLPIVTSYADAKKYGVRAEFEREAKYTDFYTLLMPSVAAKGEEFRQSIVKI